MAKHICDKSPNDWQISIDDNELDINVGEFVFIIAYCPFCGCKLV